MYSGREPPSLFATCSDLFLDFTLHLFGLIFHLVKTDDLKGYHLNLTVWVSDVVTSGVCVQDCNDSELSSAMGQLFAPNNQFLWLQAL